MSSREFQKKLIELVKNHPVIYNSLDRDQKQAWQNISQELGAPEFLCQDQWKRVRNRYAYSLKNNKNAELVGELEFLRAHMDPDARLPQQPNEPGPSNCENETAVHYIDDDDELDWYNYSNPNKDTNCSDNAFKKRKVDTTESAEFGAQYLANPVLNDTASTVCIGPSKDIKDFIIILSSTLEDLNDEQLKKFKRRVFALLNEVSDEK